MNLDNIGPATKTVALDARTAVEVSGLSLRKLTQLIGTYPKLAGFMAGGRVDLVAILADGPDMALAIFSIGVVGVARRRFWQRASMPLDDNLIAAFERAAAGRQLAVLAGIFDLTFKGGERALPFLKGLVAALAPPPAPSEAVATPSESSPPPSSDS